MSISRNSGEKGVFFFYKYNLILNVLGVKKQNIFIRLGVLMKCGYEIMISDKFVITESIL